MRMLLLHCDSIDYSPIKKEIKSAEEITIESKHYEEIVVAFITVENDDDSTISLDAMNQIKEYMKGIDCKKLLLYPYAHLSSNLASPNTALKLLKEMERDTVTPNENRKNENNDTLQSRL